MNPFGGANGWFLQTVQTPVRVVYENTLGHGEALGTEHAAGHGTEHAGAAEETPRWQQHPDQEATAHAVHESHTSAMIASLILTALGILIAFLVYIRKMIDTDAFVARIKPLHTFLMKKWYFDEIYEQWIVVPFVMLFSRSMAWFDTHIVDGAVNGVAWLTRKKSAGVGLFDKYVVDGGVNLAGFTVGFFGLVFRKAQSGRIQTYLALVLTGIVLLFYAFR
jgi:NADH-quinone oxidoreductase subunit L